MAVSVPSRFFDGRQARGHDATLAIENGAVLIRYGEAAVTWPLRRLTARADPDGGVTLRHGRAPACLVVADPALLQALRGHGLRRLPRRQTGWRVALVIAAGLLAMGMALVTGLPAALAPLVPPSWEGTLGHRAQGLLLAAHRPCTGPAGQRALDGLVSRLAAAAGMTEPIQLTVADDALVNAFTLPGNRIVVMRGLIDAVPDGDELAGVLAHELGHVAHHDPVRQLLRQLGLGVIGAGFGWGGLSSGGVASTLVGLSYGRAAEADADAFAIATLRRAGLRADGLGRFFDLIVAEDIPGISFLSDHPATTDRRARAQQPADGAHAFDDAQWRGVRAMCRP